jgi:hypothetical protein
MKDKLQKINALTDCKITAAKDDEGKDKLPKIDIEGYNGGIMSVGYWGDVVIDLAGLKASDTVPILFSHSTFSTDSILGQTSKVINDGKTLSLVGELMSDSQTAKEVKTLAGNGFKFQASVGVDPMQYSEVETGVDVEVNGQSLKGPFTIIQSAKLNEISVVPLGADGSTSARIAAEQATHKENNMKPDEKKQDAPEQPTAEAIRAAAVSEELRISKVREVGKDHPEIVAEAIKNGWSPDKVELAVAKADLAAEKARNERPAGVNVQVKQAPAVNSGILAAAVSMRAGLKDAEKQYDSETLEKAHDLKLHSFTDLVKAAMAASGKVLEHSRHETREFLQAAFSTRDIANVLSNVANKFIREGYGTVENTWREVSAIRPVVDFKANTGVRLVMANLLKNLGPGGEIEHGQLSDETRTVQADTKALMLGISRKDIINDDLSVLSDIPRRLGYAAARTFNTDFWTVFEAAVAANFETGGTKANQTTGALTTTTLAAAEKLFLGLTDADGNPIGTEASTLLCGSTAYTSAREIFVSTDFAGGSAKTPVKNIYANMFKPAFSRYLSANPWYLVANPLSMPLMETAFLNGREEPFVETADADFNTLGVQMRAYYDYGAAFAEWRSAVRSTGE